MAGNYEAEMRNVKRKISELEEKWFVHSAEVFHLKQQISALVNGEKSTTDEDIDRFNSFSFTKGSILNLSYDSKF